MFCWAIAHHVQGKRPRLKANDWWVIVAGWAFWTLAMAQWTKNRTIEFDPPLSPAIFLLPMAATVGFVGLGFLILSGNMRDPRRRRDAGARFLRVALLWLIVYDAAWMAGAGLFKQAATHLVLLGAAYGSMQLMTVASAWGDRVGYAVKRA